MFSIVFVKCVKIFENILFEYCQESNQNILYFKLVLGTAKS